MFSDTFCRWVVSLVQSGTLTERSHGTIFACMAFHMMRSQFSVAGRSYRCAEVCTQFGFALISTSTTKFGAYIILIPTKMKCILTQLGRARVQISAGQRAVCSGDTAVALKCSPSWQQFAVNRSVYWKEVSLIAGALYSAQRANGKRSCQTESVYVDSSWFVATCTQVCLYQHSGSIHLTWGFWTCSDSQDWRYVAAVTVVISHWSNSRWATTACHQWWILTWSLLCGGSKNGFCHAKAASVCFKGKIFGAVMRWPTQWPWGCKSLQVLKMF